MLHAGHVVLSLEPASEVELIGRRLIGHVEHLGPQLNADLSSERLLSMNLISGVCAPLDRSA